MIAEGKEQKRLQKVAEGKEQKRGSMLLPSSEARIKPKNQTIQRQIHAKKDRKLDYPVQNMTRPANAIVLYFVGRSDGKFIKLGIAEDVSRATKRLEAHTKSVRQAGHEFKFLAAVWAQVKDEAFLKQLWASKAIIPGETELVVADEEVLGWLRYLRRQQHCAQKAFPDLDRIGFVDFEFWRPSPEHWIPVQWEEDQMSFLDSLDTESKDKSPFHDVLSCVYRPENDYFSPSILTISARECFGGTIDLDPASCVWANEGDAANPGVQAVKFFTQFEDGLRQPWHGRVWLNPPFNQWKLWVAKIIEEVESGRVKEIIVYCTFQSATTKTFNQVLRRAAATLITNGRINCWGPNATSTNADGNLLAYLGPNPNRFCEVFSAHGVTSLTWPIRP